MARIIVSALLILVAGAFSHSRAADVAKVSDSDVTITLTDEKCALSSVSNLPYRAYWDESGKHYEGCFAVRKIFVLLYFDDKSVVVLPAHAFEPLKEV